MIFGWRDSANKQQPNNTECTFCWSLPENILSLTQISVSLPSKYIHFNELTFIFGPYKIIKHFCIFNHLHYGVFYSANIRSLTLFFKFKKDNKISITC